MDCLRVLKKSWIVINIIITYVSTADRSYNFNANFPTFDFFSHHIRSLHHIEVITSINSGNNTKLTITIFLMTKTKLISLCP